MESKHSKLCWNRNCIVILISNKLSHTLYYYNGLRVVLVSKALVAKRLSFKNWLPVLISVSHFKDKLQFILQLLIIITAEYADK